MDFHKAVVASLLILSCSVLVDGECFTDEEGGTAHCCDQRKREGPLVCCEGRNITCAVENPAEGNECYCDEFCHEAGDCCPDFEKAREQCKLDGEFVLSGFSSRFPSGRESREFQFGRFPFNKDLFRTSHVFFYAISC